MKLATFRQDGGPRLGAVIDGDRKVLDLEGAFRRLRGRAEPALNSMLALIDAGPAGRAVADGLVADPPQEDVLALEAVQLLAPLPEPRQIRDFLCFEEHLRNAFAQAGRLTGKTFEIPAVWYEQPIYYKGNRFSVVGPDADVCWPAYAQLLDYELELACVLGTGGCRHRPRRRPGSRLRLHDLQRRLRPRRPDPGDGRPARPGQGQGLRHRQRPRTLDRDRRRDRRSRTTSPWSPASTARSGAGGTSAAMHHRFEDVIAYVSQSETLHPGEVLGSGTVGTGCGLEAGPFPLGRRPRRARDREASASCATASYGRTSNEQLGPRPPDRTGATPARRGQCRCLRLHPARRHAGGSTTPASWSAGSGSSPSTPAPPSGAPGRSSTPSAGVTAAPVRTLVNTHHHGDHTFGNYLFHRRHDRRATTAARGRDARLRQPVLGAVLDRHRVGRHRDRAAVPHLRRPAHPLRRRPARRGAPPRHAGPHDQRLVVWIPEHRVAVHRRSGLQRRHAVRADGLASPVRSTCLATDPRVRRRRRSSPATARSAGRRCSTASGATSTSSQRTARRGRAAGLTPLEAARETDLGEFAALHRPRADRRQPAPGLRRTRRRERGRPIDLRGALGRHGHLQRRQAAALPGLNSSTSQPRSGNIVGGPTLY